MYPPWGRRSSSAWQEKLRLSFVRAVLLNMAMALLSAPPKVWFCRVSLPWSRLRVRLSRGFTASAVHSMVKAPPTNTHEGCSFSVT